MATRGPRRALAVVQLAILGFGTGCSSRPTVSAKSGELKTPTVGLSNQAALPEGPAAPIMATRILVPGVRNFAEVTPTLYRGGQANEEGWRNLAKMGVAIVVDLRVTGRGSEREQVTEAGMQFVSIPWNCFYPNDSDIARFLEVLRENPGKKVYVHCYIGDDRTGLEIAAFRMAEQGWTSKQARKEMEAFGFDFVHRRLCTGMGSYETHFPERFAKDKAFEKFRAEAATANSQPTR